jgi:hypothetical protein
MMEEGWTDSRATWRGTSGREERMAAGNGGHNGIIRDSDSGKIHNQDNIKKEYY